MPAKLTIMDERTVKKDSVIGSLLGGAVGDALGYPVEFWSTDEIFRKYGKPGITEMMLNDAGFAEVSDDTQMTLFTANEICFGMTRGAMRGVGGNPCGYVQHAYLDWLYTQEHEYFMDLLPEDYHPCCWIMAIPELYSRRAPGNTCITALRALRDGKPVTNDSCGCGSVMRLAPVGLIPDYSTHPWEQEQLQEAIAGAEITHKHFLSTLASVFFVALIYHLSHEVFSFGTFEEYIAIAKDATRICFQREDSTRKSYIDKFFFLIDKAVALAHENNDDPRAIEAIGGGWTAHEAVAIAVYACVKYQESFEKAVIAAVNHGGDSDSTGSLCGNLMGAWLGKDAIPKRWTEHLELYDTIEELAKDLAGGIPISEYEPRDTVDKQNWFFKYCEQQYLVREQIGARKLIQDEGFFDAVSLVCLWNDYFVFEPYCREWCSMDIVPIIGYPQYILTKPGHRPRWADDDEIRAIMDYLPDDEEDE